MSYALHIDRNNVSNSVVDACASQVEYLCAHGADVNRGLRSSSLHYAACFGRPLIVRVRQLMCNVMCLVMCILYGYIRFRRRILILLIICIPCSSILLTLPENSPRNKLTSTYLSSLSLFRQHRQHLQVVALVFHVLSCITDQ